jgi:drug/metabolite transporter (DMT)-like permease
MTARTLAWILVSVMFSSLAQMLFKIGVSSVGPERGSGPDASANALVAMLWNPGVLGGLALYGFGTLIWLSVLSRVQLSQAYPFVGLSFVLTAAFGYLVFRDDMGALRMFGILLIVTGVCLVGRS